MISEAFVVTGMTCGHCAAAVTEEVEGLPGVRGISVDVASGQVILTSDYPVNASLVGSAVEQAGYHLVAREPR